MHAGLPDSQQEALRNQSAPINRQSPCTAATVQGLKTTQSEGSIAMTKEECNSQNIRLGFAGRGNRRETRALLSHAAKEHRTVGDLARHLAKVKAMEQMLLKGGA